MEPEPGHLDAEFYDDDLDEHYVEPEGRLETEPVLTMLAPAIVALILRLALNLFGLDLSDNETLIADLVTATLAAGGTALGRARAWSPAGHRADLERQYARAEAHGRVIGEQAGAQYIVDVAEDEQRRAAELFEASEEFEDEG